MAHAIENNAVTLNSQLGSPVYISMTSHTGSVVAILMDKETASQWHAPIISGRGIFSRHFSIGTNERPVYFAFSRLLHNLTIYCSVLVGGPYLVRTASIVGSTLALVSHLFFYLIPYLIYIMQTGDVNGTTSVETIAPAGISIVTWNNISQVTTRTAHGSLKFTVNSTHSVSLPALNSWKVSGRFVHSVCTIKFTI